MTTTFPEEARVLIVDDEESMRDACCRVLLKEGYQVRTASDGETALTMVSNQTPDIILLDLKMPHMAGMAVLDELRSLAPNTVKVVITAYATVNAALEAMRHGAHDFLPKPFTPDELRMVAGRALERRSLMLKNLELEKERQESHRGLQKLLAAQVEGHLEAAQAPLARLQERLKDRPQENQLLSQATKALEKLGKLLEEWQGQK